MGNIDHWRVRLGYDKFGGQPTASVTHSPENWSAERAGEVVELVPASQLQGAVARAEKAEAEVERLKREYQVGYVDGRRDERGSSFSNPGGGSREPLD